MAPAGDPGQRGRRRHVDAGAGRRGPAASGPGRRLWPGAGSDSQTRLTNPGSTTLGSGPRHPRSALCGCARPPRITACCADGVHKTGRRCPRSAAARRPGQPGVPPALRAPHRAARLCARGVGPAQPRAAAHLPHLPPPGGPEGLPPASARFATRMRAICPDRTRIEQRERVGQGRGSAGVTVKAVLGPSSPRPGSAPLLPPQRAGGTMAGGGGHSRVTQPPAAQSAAARLCTRSPLVSGPRRDPHAENKEAQARF